MYNDNFNNKSFIDEIKEQFAHGNMVIKLLMVNVGAFVVFNIFFWLFTQIIRQPALYEEVLAWLMVPANIKYIFLQPWSFISYMFLHDGFLHILSNMIVLYVFGQILYELMGSVSNRKILPIYILGGLSGALLYLICFFLFPPLRPESGSTAYLIGASASAMSIMLAATTLSPNYRVNLFLFGVVRIKYIAMFFLLMDIMLISKDNPGGHIAHLGGALFGFLYIQQLKQGTDWATGFNNFVDALVSALSGKGKKLGPRMVYKNEEASKKYYGSDPKWKRSSKTAKFNKNKQEKVDAILDKIAESGYESLTTEEKTFLFQVSRDEE